MDQRGSAARCAERLRLSVSIHLIPRAVPHPYDRQRRGAASPNRTLIGKAKPFRTSVVATTYEDERHRNYFKDKSFEADYNLIQKQLPGQDIDFASSTKDEKLWIVDAGSDTEPGAAYLFDRGTKKLTLQYRIREKLNRDYLAPMKAIRYKSSDGLEIPAYLTLPKGVPARN